MHYMHSRYWKTPKQRGEGGRKKEEGTKEKERENPEVVLFQSTEYLGFQGDNPTSQPK